MRFDLKTTEGLRTACREAERRLDPESMARNADFLEQVSKTPEAEPQAPQQRHQLDLLDGPQSDLFDSHTARAQQLLRIDVDAVDGR